MACLDTEILVEVLRGNSAATEFVDSLARQGDASTTTINACELFKGAYKTRAWEKNVLAAEKLVGMLKILDFDLNGMRLFGRLHAENEKKNGGAKELDLMIASIAIANGEKLVSRDKHFKKIQGLKISGW